MELPGRRHLRDGGRQVTLNRELFVEDPTTKNIPNLGVAKVGPPDRRKGLESPAL